MSGQHRAARDFPDLAAMRESYSLAGLAEGDLADNWVTQFQTWLADAVAAGLPEPNAMVVATASPTGSWPADRAVQGRRRGRHRLLHQPELRQESGPGRQSPCGGDLPVDRPAAAGARPWPGGPGRRRDGAGSTGPAGPAAPGSVPGPARSPACCRTGPRSRRCRSAARGAGLPKPASADPAAAVLGRLADPARDRRVLAGQIRPAARPAAVPGRSDPASWVVERLAP